MDTQVFAFTSKKIIDKNVSSLYIFSKLEDQEPKFDQKWTHDKVK